MLSATKIRREEEERHMVSSDQFKRPERDDEPEGNPGGLPFSHDKVIRLMKDMGIIPEFIPDDHIAVQMIGPDGQELMLVPEGREPPREWHLDDIFPHTSLDDPPGEATPEEYKQLILGVLSEAADLEEFTIEVSRGLGPDLVLSHGVEPNLAMQVCMDFAKKIYKEYRENA